MDIRFCPNCEKVFYVLKEEDLLRCRHCDFELLERRGGGRVNEEMDFAITMETKRMKARLKDYSSSGLRASYQGSMLNVNTEISIALDPLRMRRRAITVWSKRAPGRRFESGFRFIGTGNE